MIVWTSNTPWFILTISCCVTCSAVRSVTSSTTLPYRATTSDWRRCRRGGRRQATRCSGTYSKRYASFLTRSLADVILAMIPRKLGLLFAIGVFLSSPQCWGRGRYWTDPRKFRFILAFDWFVLLNIYATCIEVDYLDWFSCWLIDWSPWCLVYCCSYSSRHCRVARFRLTRRQEACSKSGPLTPSHTPQTTGHSART